MNNTLLILLIIISLVISAISVVLLLVLFKTRNHNELQRPTNNLETNIHTENSALRQEINLNVAQNVKNMGEMLSTNQQSFSRSQDESQKRLEERFKTFSLENEQRLDLIRKSVENRLELIQEDNNKQLETMRETVDETLQKTLEEKMNKSFSLVNERLEQVYKGLGEMQNLAVGVGDLKKVLSNVKTRGILGEIQLGAILKEILSPEQYEENVVTKKGSGCPVEFAVKLPGDGNGTVYLPIDSKFPGDTYAALRDAYDSGEKE